MERSSVRVIDGRADRPRPKQRSRAAWLVGGLVIGLLVGYALSPSIDRPVGGSGPESESGVGLLETPSSPEAIIPLGARIPHLGGSLVATVGVRDFELVIWPADLAVPESINIGDTASPAGSKTPLTWDASGSTYAFLRKLDGSETALHVGSEAEYLPLARRVKSFAWHSTEPKRLAWTVASDGGVGQQLFVSEVAGSASEELLPSVTLSATERLVAWDETGFVFGFWDKELGEEWTRRVDDSGREIGRARGSLVAIRGNGELLLTELAGRGSLFYRADPTLGTLTALEWAPEDAWGRVKPAAWSSDGRIAFIALDTRFSTWRLEIFGPDGGSPIVQELPGQVWDVNWSPDGRFIVMPGFDNRGERGHLVFAYDSFEALLYEIEVDGRVASVFIRP